MTTDLKQQVLYDQPTTKNMETGLKQQILSAKSIEEVQQLLNTGKTYEFASQSTRNSWRNAGRRATAYFKGEKYIAPVSVDEQVEVTVTPKKKRGNKKKEVVTID